MRRVRAYVGLGANVGDARATLVRAVRAISALPGVRLRGVSQLYRSRPVGVVDQPDFHNAAVALDVPAGPDPETGALALLIALKRLGRTVEFVRYQGENHELSRGGKPKNRADRLRRTLGWFERHL